MQNVIDTAVATILARIGGDRPVCYRDWWIDGVYDDGTGTPEKHVRLVNTTLEQILFGLLDDGTCLQDIDDLQTIHDVDRWHCIFGQSRFGGVGSLMDPAKTPR